MLVFRYRRSCSHATSRNSIAALLANSIATIPKHHRAVFLSSSSRSVYGTFSRVSCSYRFVRSIFGTLARYIFDISINATITPRPSVLVRDVVSHVSVHSSFYYFRDIKRILCRHFFLARLAPIRALGPRCSRRRHGRSREIEERALYDGCIDSRYRSALDVAG